MIPLEHSAPGESILPGATWAQSGSGAGSVAAWFAVLLVVIVAAAGVLYALRRGLLNRQAPADRSGMTLDDLRQMRSRGWLTEAEFDAARRVVLRQSGIDPDAPTWDRNPLTDAPRSRSASGTADARHSESPETNHDGPAGDNQGDRGSQ